VTSKTASRTTRTFIQGVLALAAAVPAAAAAFNLSAADTAKVGGVVAAVVVFITFVQNLLEGAGVIPVVAGTTPIQVTDPMEAAVMAVEQAVLLKQRLEAALSPKAPTAVAPAPNAGPSVQP